MNPEHCLVARMRVRREIDESYPAFAEKRKRPFRGA
jgi:hypothetical protein